MEIKIAIVNRTADLRDEDVVPVVAALQRQVNDHFAPAWGIGAALGFVPKGENPPPDYWQQWLVDDPMDANVLGEHQVTEHGYPIGFTSLRADKDAGLPWEPTLSHELLEMLADPFAFSLVFNPFAREFIWLEVGDPVEAVGYEIDGVPLSDFVLPAWFGDPRASSTGLFSLLGAVDRPFKLAPGGYVGVVRADGSVYQTTARKNLMEQAHREEPAVGSRRWRRLGGKNLNHQFVLGETQEDSAAVKAFFAAEKEQPRPKPTPQPTSK